ncbi:LysR family transcriptional regulator [Cohnella sp. JJ-181]|uniref:LysR family transcriptional regulator n=1 Tax=Cohnella rhizoplanae TaxID=2974897 RepID=UPI0022FF5603|nr:LysR family transcriptional regulator [Cohnella sp. JJ-181]CAI6081824.1 HTH-type transcriptional regulator YofA [Cohnella sp. JJ-181]
MESGDLRIFRTVALEGTVTAAAAKLGYVQSNVTARIRQLETDLGKPLFHRHNRGMTLTADGKLLLDYAGRIVGLLDEAAKAVSSPEGPLGPLAIASTQSCAAVRLPSLLAGYHRSYPDVELSLSTGNSAAVLEKVLRYEADGGFLAGPWPEAEISAVPAFDEEIVLVSSPERGPAGELGSEPMLVFTDGCYYRSVLERWTKEHAWAQPRIMEFGTLEAIIGGVSAGLGISLMPRSVVAKAEADGTVRVHPLPDPYNRIRTYFVMRRDAYVSRPLALFLEELAAVRETMPEIAADASGGMLPEPDASLSLGLGPPHSHPHPPRRGHRKGGVTA